jgi:hypothetical protein
MTDRKKMTGNQNAELDLRTFQDRLNWGGQSKDNGELTKGINRECRDLMERPGFGHCSLKRANTSNSMTTIKDLWPSSQCPSRERIGKQPISQMKKASHSE